MDKKELRQYLEEFGFVYKGKGVMTCPTKNTFGLSFIFVLFPIGYIALFEHLFDRYY